MKAEAKLKRKKYYNIIIFLNATYMVGIFTQKKLSGGKLLTITNYSYMFDITYPYLNYFLFTNPEDPFSPLILNY